MNVLVNPKKEFEYEVPVVIVGAGACGLCAALAAKESGANVLVSGSTVFNQNNGNLKKNIELLRSN